VDGFNAKVVSFSAKAVGVEKIRRFLQSSFASIDFNFSRVGIRFLAVGRFGTAKDPLCAPTTHTVPHTNNAQIGAYRCHA
jgi:hypothetical protein